MGRPLLHLPLRIGAFGEDLRWETREISLGVGSWTRASDFSAFRQISPLGHDHVGVNNLAKGQFTCPHVLNTTR